MREPPTCRRSSSAACFDLRAITLSFARRVFLALTAAATNPAHACTQVAAVPITLIDGYPIVSANLAGTAVSLLLDTGAQGMLVTPEIATALSLPLAGLTRIYGTGGSQQARLVRLPGLRLGGAPMPGLVAPIAPLPIPIRMQPPLAGLLGASLLSRFDVLIDILAGRLILQLPGECPHPPGRTIPLEVSRAGEPYAVVRVNGQPLLALLDTGSRATLLTDTAAKRLGLAAPVAASTARGIDGEVLPLRYVRAHLALGDGPAIDMPISVAPIQLDRGDLLLGLDVLGQQPVFLAYAAATAVLLDRAPRQP